MLAALTPDDVEVSLVDEAVDEVDLNAEVDLVGISAMTTQAPRAYQIADAFRARGVKVVLGGMHPSACPQEAAEHADAVVVGEAEGVWPRVIEDAGQGRLQQFYQADTRPDLADVPVPRRDLLNQDAYLTTGLVQASRGCPFGCSFCTVTRFFGRTYRFRPVEKVIEEVAGLREKLVIFVDDNIMGLPAYSKRFFEQLAGLGKTWFSQASLTMLKDARLLKLAARSGCRGLFVGLESLSQSALQHWGKNFNAGVSYRDAIARLHDHGIGVIGSFIFGADEDDPDVFDRTVEFVERAHLDAAQFSILTPLPGTRFYEEMEREDRLIDRNWAHYDGGHVVFRPRNMSADKLREGFHRALRQVYSLTGIIRRTWDGWLRRPVFGYVNLAFRQRIGSYLRRVAAAPQWDR